MTNWGSIADGAAAGGSVIASVVALVIASRDRRERAREREAGELAQARLVLIDVSKPEWGCAYPMTVRNLGDRPILNVKVEAATIDGISDARAVPLEGRPWEAVPVLEPGGRTGYISVSFPGNDGVSPLGDQNRDPLGNSSYPDAPDPSRVRVTVVFTDADGVQWRRTRDETPRRIYT